MPEEDDVNDAPVSTVSGQGRNDDKLEVLVLRESRFVLLNLGALVSLVLVHVAVVPFLGSLSRVLAAIFVARVVMLLGELWWLRTRSDPEQAPIVRAYGNASLLFTIAFAFLASIMQGTEDTHYSVLMITPIIAAAFKFSLPATIGVASVASAFTVLQVWLYETLHPPVRKSEFFEAATTALVFLIVGIVVWQLVDQLRGDSARLAASLEELERTRDRLVEEKKLAAIGRLSSAIAHEIRNPVAMISSSLATAARGGSEPVVRDEMLSIAKDEAARLERLTTDFLSYARSRPPERKTVELASVLGYVADLTRSRAAELGVSIAVDCSGDESASVDQFQIHQALLNLVLNAIDATLPGGMVTLSCARRSDGWIELSVENTGEAIAASEVERIFEPFHTTKPAGTGLGLGIARNVILAHGGDLTLARNEPGRVTFTVALAPDARMGNESH